MAASNGLRRRFGVGVFVLVLTALTAGWAQAAQRMWTGTVDDDWFEAGNWSPDDNYPQADDSVTIPSGASVLLANGTAALAAGSRSWGRGVGSSTGTLSNGDNQFGYHVINERTLRRRDHGQSGRRIREPPHADAAARHGLLLHSNAGRDDDSHTLGLGLLPTCRRRLIRISPVFRSCLSG